MPKQLYEDEELAEEEFQDDYVASRKVLVEQELQDEELARQLAKAEERALAAEERARGRPPARPWTMRRACSFIVPLVIVIVGAIALAFAISEESQAPPTVLRKVPFFEGEDPWEGLKPKDVARWNNGGAGGLKLDVVDALQGQWEDIFHAVVKDWDEGTPKVLSLSTEKEGHDPACEPIDNKSKVCNGNYGDSQWRGINQVLIQNGYIVAATSKMNEFYLEKANNAQKRYTLCHELGHSFGLAHTDENFFNAPLGNCMDYTDNPEVNKSPDLSNFEFLEDLYGSFPGRQRDRLLEPGGLRTEKRIPDNIRAKLKEIVPVFENRRNGAHHEKGWRLLKRSNHAEAHEISLGKGWVLRMTKLLVL